MTQVAFESIAAVAATGLPETPTKELLIGLDSRYSEPWRHYHTAQHIAELFASLTQHIEHVRNPRTIGWAMLYHDAVYDPTAVASRNEELSARLAESELPRILSAHETRQVAKYTRATASHKPANAGDDDFDFFLDADLAILGATPERYQQYSKDIKLEYAHVPDDAYREARVGVLQGLASRVGQSSLFRTTLFKEIYEESAHQNIALEIQSLS
ncbi:MAG TPA: hypothetical protein VK694_00995 [Verrucomicrobiae bacterium]|nr:hypothetical protein [Verrucomicrobiae bacterium]